MASGADETSRAPTPELFVGRARELTELSVGLERAEAGHGQVVLLVGEPGIGKTRLAAELASQCQARGTSVYWGRCWEGGGAPAYWPWIQIIRSIVREPAAGALLDSIGSAAGFVAQLVPEVLPVTEPPNASPTGTEPEHARFALFDAVSTFFHAAADVHPIVMILDDLHAADLSSLLFLQFLTSELVTSRILVLGSYRHTEAPPVPAVRMMLGEVAREARRIPLGGLSGEDVASFMEGITGERPSAGLVDAVHQVTEGNPFFVDEVVRLIASQRWLHRDDVTAETIGVPHGVRDAIRRRISGLSPSTARVLATAAVAGRDFHTSVLERAAGMSQNEILDVLSEAAERGFLSGAPHALRRSRFSHALIRETIYDDLSPGLRMTLHDQVGRALEETSGQDLEPHLAELAHHFYSAAPVGGVEKALDYAVRAGERAASLFAYEGAAAQYERALQLLELTDDGDRRRCEFLLSLGDAQRRAGDMPAAGETFIRASELARRTDDAELFARAVLGYGSGFGAYGVSAYRASDVLIELLEEALARLPQESGPLRVRVLARLASELYSTNEVERRQRLSDEAIEMARALGDQRLLLEALLNRYRALLGPDSLEERLRIVKEMRAVAHENADKEFLFQAEQAYICTLVEAGDLSEIRDGIESCKRLAEDLRMPIYRWQARVLEAGQALRDGSLADSERLGEEFGHLGRRVPAPVAATTYWAHLMFLRWMQGRVLEVEDAAKSLTEQFPISAWSVGLPFLYVMAGRTEDARAAFQRAASSRFATVPRNASWSIAMAMAAHVCVALSDDESAAVVYELLGPFEARTGTTSLGNGANTGSNATPLGMLAGLMRRWEDAEHHFERGLAQNKAIGDRPNTAVTLIEYAAALRARAQAGDDERASQLLSEAFEMIDRYGFNGLRDRVRQIASAHEAGHAAPDHGVLRREGDYWTVTYGGSTFRIRDLKGLGYLARLLCDPYREVHVMDLARGSVEGSVHTRAALREHGVAAVDMARADKILDAEAREQYRRRIAEIREEIDEARSWGDAERVARAEQELEALTGELSGAVGLGGRPRTGPSAADRARVSVTKALRAAIDRIGRESTPLGAHLSASIRTGWFCSYSPEPEALIRWRT